MTGAPFSAHVVSVNISEETGTIKHPVAEVVIGDQGIMGDAHAGPGPRQVSLLAVESVERFAAEVGRQFRPGEFAENLTTRGVDLRAVRLLDRFAMGSVELEVTQIGKPCHAGDCAVFREVGRCVMPKEGVFCRVIRGGVVRPRDPIAYQRKTWRVRVLTISDRASCGAYEDRSGPEVVKLLAQFFDAARWHADIERRVLPDDADQIRAALGEARDQGADMVFTTGGTGIGPRDVTPDVVMAVADKTIPGIMDHIRIKFGAQNPRALLSRSVAAIMGRTLVYALPGSVRAVEEYMGEVLHTLEHALLTLHGLDLH